MKKSQHVVPRSGGWGVRGAGNSRDTGLFQTQNEAVARARRIARNQGSELLIHGRDGRIRERSSYGHVPVLSKG